MEKVLCYTEPDKPPQRICLDTNTEETLSFLEHMSKSVLPKRFHNGKPTAWIHRQKNRPPFIGRYAGFEDIDEFSAAPALVLAALYDRAKDAMGTAPPAINFPNWSPTAFQTLFELGFFEIIGHSPAERITEIYDRKAESAYKISKILSGHNANSLEEASDTILELLRYLEIDPDLSDELIIDINTAVSEAMINVSKHAYPDWLLKEDGEVQPKKWWMSARADKSSNKLTIVVYDQGATIPGTLPERDWYREALESLMGLVSPGFDLENRKRTMDHEFISYSMKKGKTQTGVAERGLGLPQMQELIDTCSDGTLSILSRQGLYKYARQLGVHKRLLPTALEGTLIQWELSLPVGGR
ncbi:ATP-binding protein [Salipiger bermudensis]|uniref:ATP-binding protein n=1 Tax=Salipiger bermudensis TaxID=344736 RepID=UPI001C99483F|nr:ATP-binding protein [Salipiger bermudensis]MBY6006721.1 ATP-binding protein [Salipiger bermudensis]